MHMTKKRHLMIWFLCFGIYAVAFILFIGMKLSSGQAKPSFFSDISEIAANEEYVYVLDDRNTKLSAYKNNGDYVWCINFSSTGVSRIFCDADGSICLVDIGRDKVWVYDEQGNELNCYQAPYGELISNGTFDKHHIEDIEINGTDNVKYILRDHIIIDSTIVVSQSGETMAEIVVESWASHVLWYVIVAAVALSIAYGAYNLICFILLNSGMMGSSGKKNS